MFDKDADAGTQPKPAEVAAVTSEEADAASKASTVTRTIRYMDDETFRNRLEEVVVTHSRLLSKLAE